MSVKIQLLIHCFRSVNDHPDHSGWLYLAAKGRRIKEVPIFRDRSVQDRVPTCRDEDQSAVVVDVKEQYRIKWFPEQSSCFDEYFVKCY
jgi:hypothetical protein